MQIHTSDNPAKEVGAYIANAINSHNDDVLCLLSGGSAFAVVEHIPINESECRAPRALPTAPPKGRTESCDSEKCECRKIIYIMGDERVSGEDTINNYLQLSKQYPNHPIIKHTIATVPEENESVETFANRIEKTFLETVSELRNPKIISLMGLGPDGHTAGIFPMDKESFQSTYRDDGTYVPVHMEGLTIDSRASITPKWLLDNVDEMFLYVTGEAKRKILESLILETKELHERPSELIKRHPNAHLFTDIFLEPK